MSKIFEMLRKGQGEISESILRSLEGEQQPQPQEPGLTDADKPAAAGAVAGFAAAAPALAADPALSDPQTSFRTLPVRLSASSPVLPFDAAEFVATEQYRIIRTRLIQHPSRPRIVLFSSPGPGDGKSITAVNVAGAMSLKTEAKVLLMDAEFRRSTLHTRLGLPPSPGLTDVLTGEANLEDALIRIEQFPNLYVIPCGQARPNPSELLDSACWPRVVGQLRNLFDYVIADAPPVASVADYELLQAACDGVVLVVRPDHTNRQACLKAVEIIPKGKLLGVVMNCVPKWFLSRGHHYTPYHPIPRTDQPQAGPAS